MMLCAMCLVILSPPPRTSSSGVSCRRLPYRTGRGTLALGNPRPRHGIMCRVLPLLEDANPPVSPSHAAGLRLWAINVGEEGERGD